MKKSTVVDASTTFRIQLASVASAPNKNLYSKAGTITVDQVDGLYKVTTGNYALKQEAIDKMIELKAKGINGFIVKYENGKRSK